jgi:hypothetical protein
MSPKPAGRANTRAISLRYRGRGKSHPSLDRTAPRPSTPGYCVYDAPEQGPAQKQYDAGHQRDDYSILNRRNLGRGPSVESRAGGYQLREKPNHEQCRNTPQGYLSILVGPSCAFEPAMPPINTAFCVVSPIRTSVISSVYWVNSSSVLRSSWLYIRVTARAARRRLAQAQGNSGIDLLDSFCMN